MHNITKAAITGVGGWVPEVILTNADLEKLVDTNDEWIVTRTGIKTRHILEGDNKGTSIIVTNAVKQLLEKTNTDPRTIDLVICATSTPDMVFPATANIVCDNIGATNSWGYDLQAACSGFIYAISTGSQYIASGMCKKVIVIGADKMSSIIDYTNRNTCIIFGDGGGAVLLEPSQDENGIQDFLHKSDGSGGKYLKLIAGGSCKPASIETVQAKEHFVYQEGNTVFKSAVKAMSSITTELMNKNGLNSNDIKYLVPHQANKRIIEATAKAMNLPMERVMLNINKYGNTTSGTIPLCLYDYENKLKKGDKLILAAFGGGFTWGSVYIKWAYNT